MEKLGKVLGFLVVAFGGAIVVGLMVLAVKDIWVAVLG